MKHAFNLDTYTTFLVANGNRYSGVEVSKALRGTVHAPAHDSISRWLKDQTFEPNNLWKHARSKVDMESSLIVDDTLLDKRWSPRNELVDFHWSGNEHKVTRGISLVNLLATHDNDCIPVDYRVYAGNKDEKNKNEHFMDMLKNAKKRGFTPDFVLAESWYSSLDNMKYIQRLAGNSSSALRRIALSMKNKGSILRSALWIGLKNKSAKSG